MDLLIIGAALERQSYWPIVSPKLKTYADPSLIRGLVTSKAKDSGINFYQYHSIHDIYGAIWENIVYLVATCVAGWLSCMFVPESIMRAGRYLKAQIHADFCWPSWQPSWKLCNCYWFLHIQTLRHSLYMNPFVFVSKTRAKIHSNQNFDGHIGRHLDKINLYWLSYSWMKIVLDNSYPAYSDEYSNSSMKIQ